jgi:hypothetical protein
MPPSNCFSRFCSRFSRDSPVVGRAVVQLPIYQDHTTSERSARTRHSARCRR